MAKLTLNFRPDSLQFNTTVNIILPEDVNENTPTLWLLHGMYGDCNSWTNESAIGRYARERKMAVIMPSAENSFYCNMKYGYNYYDFIVNELPEYIRKILPLSEDRDKNFIAGLSMGGYGAFKIALRNPQNYAAAASLSGCVDIASRLTVCNWKDIAVCNWGEDYATCVKGTDDDLLHLIENFPEDAPKPRLYSSCGTEDRLYGQNVDFRDFMKDRDFEFSYNEGPGIHNWKFWDEWISPAVDYMLGKEKK